MDKEQFFLMAKADLEDIVYRDEKAHNIYLKVKRTSKKCKSISFDLKLVLPIIIFTGLYCLYYILFRFENSTYYWILALYIYVCFILMLPTIFRNYYKIPNRYELLYLNLVLAKNRKCLCNTPEQKIWIHYQIECYWYGVVQIHSYLDYMNTVVGIEKD